MESSLLVGEAEERARDDMLMRSDSLTVSLASSWISLAAAPLKESLSSIPAGISVNARLLAAIRGWMVRMTCFSEVLGVGFASEGWTIICVC